MNNALKDFIKTNQIRAENSLNQRLPSADILPKKLHQSMRYAVLNGGKRMRPLLTYCVGKALDINLDTLDGIASAIELIHVYSLIHDDLPSMDNDDLRRGKPTCHIAFDEATAILAGDALQALAFQILANDPTITTTTEKRLQMINLLAKCSGSRGMAGGQAIDLCASNKNISLPELENMHIHKTGALIRASVGIATLAGDNIEPDKIKKLDNYAKCVGLSFQIRDDVLDQTSDTSILGKTQGKDQSNNKPTYITLLGLDNANKKAKELHLLALDNLVDFGKKANLLRNLSLYIIQRKH